MHVLVLDVELHLPDSRSLKEKRKVISSLLDTARHRYQVAAAEVGHQDSWQRARLGFAAVSSSVGHLEEVVDEVERLVWSRPDVEVLSADRRWLEDDR